MPSKNDCEYAYFCLSPEYFLSNGSFLVNETPIITIPSLGSVTFAFTTGPNPPVLFSRSIYTTSDHTLNEIFEGGTYSGGIDALGSFYYRNRLFVNHPVVFVDGKTGPTLSIDTPGTKIEERHISGAKNTLINATDLRASFVYKPDTVYYATLTNSDGQAHDYQFNLTYGVIL